MSNDSKWVTGNLVTLKYLPDEQDEHIVLFIKHDRSCSYNNIVEISMYKQLSYKLS